MGEEDVDESSSENKHYLHSGKDHTLSKSQCTTQYYLLLFILKIVIFILEKMSDNKLCCIWLNEKLNNG